MTLKEIESKLRELSHAARMSTSKVRFQIIAGVEVGCVWEDRDDTVDWFIKGLRYRTFYGAATTVEEMAE